MLHNKPHTAQRISMKPIKDKCHQTSEVPHAGSIRHSESSQLNIFFCEPQATFDLGDQNNLKEAPILAQSTSRNPNPKPNCPKTLLP